MMSRPFISISIRKLAISLLLLVSASASAQLKFFTLQKDSIPVFRGFAVSFDLVGLASMYLLDYGQYEAALRVNLHDQYFPILELGYGKADHRDDEVTGITYKTTAPYFRIGMDWNILRNKHQANRMFAGFRYAFTSYKVDIIREDLPDPVWQSKSGFGVEDMGCNMHWAEIVFGIDAKLFGPLHLGWNVRYKRRIAHNDGELGTTWYVPGFGINDSDNLAVNFNVIIDI